MSIQKYDFDSFKKEHQPYTMIPSHVIQNCPPKFIQAAFLWIYLQSLPPDWKVNRAHLISHFGISERTLQSWLAWLKSVNLIDYKRVRNEGGRFDSWELIVLNGMAYQSAESCGMEDHHSAKNPHSGGIAPFINTTNINIKNTSIAQTPSAIDATISWFEEFWDLYPVRKDRKRSFDLFRRRVTTEKIFTDLMGGLRDQLRAYNKRVKQTGWAPDFKHPTTWLRGENWYDEVEGL